MLIQSCNYITELITSLLIIIPSSFDQYESIEKANFQHIDRLSITHENSRFDSQMKI